MSVKICVNSKVENIQLSAFPLIESHAGTVMFEVVHDLLHGVLCTIWSKRLPPVVTDRAVNKTGRQLGVTRWLEQNKPPWFFRIWCAAHQLDLAIQHVRWNVSKQSFWNPLVPLICYYRRQGSFRAEVGTTCPALSTTRWMSLANCNLWGSEHRERIEKYLDDKSPDVTLDSSPCVLLTWGRNFMEPVDVWFEVMQDKDTFVVEQDVLLRKLSDASMSMLNISAVSGIDKLL